MPVTAIQVVAADFINSTMWNAFPWRWSLAALTPITLVDGTQDYGSAPSDYLRLIRARITRTDITPDQSNELLTLRWIAPDLSTKLGWNDITGICYEPVLNKFRISAAAAIPSGVVAQIEGEYQKTPTKITATSATFLFPDQYFPVFVAGLVWQFYRFADDPRAGAPVANRTGSVQYSGAMGEFYDALMQMREAEDWGAGDTMFPTDPLGGNRLGSPGLFGY